MLTLRRTLLLALLASTFAFAADPKEAVMQADRDFAKATAERGLEGWLSFWGEGSYVGSDPTITGQEKLREFYKPLFARKNLKFVWSPTEGAVFPSGDLGYTTGSAEISYTKDDGTHQSGTSHYITIWKKQKDGTWKVFMDIGSNDPKK